MVNDDYLKEKGIMLPGMRKKILEACRRRLAGSREVRFEVQVDRYEPILKNYPRRGSCWNCIDDLEVKTDKRKLLAAVRTWRFCTTGIDGLEEIHLLRTAFEGWRPKKAGIGTVDVQKVAI